MQRISTLFTLLLLAVVGLQAQTVVTITDDDLQGNTSYDWTANNIYLLDGYVYLEEGGVLNIEPGTVIQGKADPTDANDAVSALIITRGAQIFAEGTATAPIVFTAEGEDGTFDPLQDRGSWGGLIILGRATVGEENNTGVANIEGIPATTNTEYGGGMNPDDADNSGVLRYVSIRYGGDILANDDEINGLTLGGVGNGTTIEYIEIFANSDDGIEWFGGSVDVKYAVVAFCGDDSFDTDQAWSGRGQYWFTVMAPNDPSGNNQNGGEHDGSESPDDNGPVQTVYNATYIGMGAMDDNGEGNTGLRIKSGGAITYGNSIFTEFGRDGLRLRANGDDDSYARFINDEFQLPANLWFGFGDGNDPNDFVRVDDGPADAVAQVVAKLLAEGNQVVDPLLNGISREADGGLDPRPGSGSPARTGAVTPPNDGFFDQTTYRGAFSPFTNWALGWTHMDELGYFGDLDGDGETIVITDADLVGGETYTWTSENVYQLDGYVYLEEGGCLNIEAGTRIEGLADPTNANDAVSALIITRGAQIKAEGTAEAPIVFTAEGEDGTFDPIQDRGSWGGLIILGRATVGEENGTGVANIEGIPATTNTEYGGGMTPDDADDSGILRYVSIRYGGDILANDDEINGLTLGGVGNGTTIEHIEVYANSDDGIEWFGGSVDVKYASVVFCGDDSFDTDQAWSGRGQYWFTLMAENDPSGNNQNGGEHDGSESPDDNGPVQTVYNATYIGMGATGDNGEGNTALRIKSGGAITYGNSIFTEFGRDGLRLRANGDDDSYARYIGGDFVLPSNLWFGFGDGNDPNDFVRVDDGPADAIAQVVTLLVAQDNEIVDPQLARINREPSADNGADGNGTDPRLLFGSPAIEGAADVPNDDFFDQTTFRGAFERGGDYWVRWTHAYEQGYLVESNAVNTTDFARNEAGVQITISPNPTAGLVSINVELPAATNATAMIFDQIGRQVTSYDLGQLQAGINQPTIDLSQLANGNYYVILNTQFGPVAQRIVVSH